MRVEPPAAGRRWRRRRRRRRSFYSVGGGESGYIAADPKNPDIFYAGNNGGAAHALNRRTGELREVNPYPRQLRWATRRRTSSERWQWTYPIIFSPVDPNVLYAASQHVWKTTERRPDAGRRSAPTSRATIRRRCGDSGGPITHDMNGRRDLRRPSSRIAPSPKDGNIIWTGSDDGSSTSRATAARPGRTSRRRTCPTSARVSLIDASPFRAGTAYVAANRYQLDDFAPYIFRTHDYGKTWTKIVDGIAPNDFVHACARIRAREGCSTRHRARRLRLVRRRRALAVAAAEPARHAGARHLVEDARPRDRDARPRFYILDDIAPLRQWGAQTTARRQYLFKPADALRGLDRALAIDYC